MAMHILFLSFYFEPDLGPAAIRNTLIAKALASHDDVESLDVITTLPHRWGINNTDVSGYERHQKMSIYRLYVPRRKGIFGQARSWTKYALRTVKLAKKKKYDLVYASSSRLATGFLGSYLSRKMNTLYYMDIRDLFMDTINEYFSNSIFRFTIPLLSCIDKYTIRGADKINILSGHFVEHIHRINSFLPVSNISHGVDPVFHFDDPGLFPPRKEKILLYAGNVGFGQSLEKIVPQIAKRLPEGWIFKVVGDGASKQKLLTLTSNASNIVIDSPVPRDKLVDIYRDADVLFLHLNDKEAFKKSMPSKIFEYAATGKPVIAGIDGYASNFIRNNNVPGFFLFTPNNVNSFFEMFFNIDCPFFDRNQFLSKWTRRSKVKEMVDDILSLNSPR